MSKSELKRMAVQCGTCRECGGEMRPGKAIEQTCSAGGRDFSGQLRGITMSYGGAGKLINCWKCKKCGWSRY